MPSVSIGVSVTAGGFPADAAAVATITGLTDGFAVTGVELTGSYPGASTAQWQSKTGAGAWTNIAGATSATFTPLIGTNVADEDLIRVVPDGDENLASAGYTVAYAAGSAPSISTQNLTVDDDVVSIDASASGANLTFTYALTTGLGNAQINSSTGEITVSGNGGAFSQGDVGTGNMEVTATDQYGRTVGPYNVPYDVSLRTQATGGADLDLSFVEDSAITATDLTANWTENGNTLTYAITGTALPAGLSVSSAGSMTGTPTTVTADATYTLRGTDEYGRTTDDTFTLEITEAVTAPDFTALTVGPQSGEDIPVSATVTGGLDPNYFSMVGITAGGTVITDAAKIRAGTDQSDADAPFWISEQSVSGNVTDQVLTVARENAFDGSMDFYAVFSTQSSGGAVSQIQSDTGISITITVDSGTLKFDAGSASTTTNEAFDGGSASSTTNEVLDFAA